MNIYRVNTTAFKEEDFFVMTTLSQEDIAEVIIPIVNEHRDGESDEDYDNDQLIVALKKRYPNDTIEHYQDFQTIII